MTSKRKQKSNMQNGVERATPLGASGADGMNFEETQTRPVLKTTLVLVGLMGSGKSSVGRRLAARLQAPFRDSDSEIEEAAGRTIPEIFADFGEPEFRKGETRVLSRLLDFPPHVLATGGGIVIAPENRELIRNSAVSVWLDADLDVLWKRVLGKTHRPLLQQDNPKAVLAALMEKRRDYYAAADVHVKSEDGLTHEDMVDRILAAIDASPYKNKVFQYD